MKRLLLIGSIGLSATVFSQGIQLELDTFNRSIPTANFGGQTWRGPSWVNTTFNDSVATMYPDVLAYPPRPDIWDWENGWFYPQEALDTCCVDTITLNWGLLNATVIDITPEKFQLALDQIGAEGLYCLNMISSSMSKQLADLNSAKDQGVKLERIRLGDEMGKAGNEHSISLFPTAEDYAAFCDVYIDSIRQILPDTKIAVSAGNFGSSNPRAEHWNDALYAMTNKADAFRWSAFFYMKDADTLFTTKQLLAYAFDQIPTYESVRDLQDTTANLQDYEIWVGYGITDNTSDKVFANRWSLVLMFSASHHMFLNNRLVEDISMFNVGGIFENWDALDTDNGFRKRATGVFAAIWNKVQRGKNRTTEIETPAGLLDTVTYYNQNNVARTTEYPELFGWRFENDSTYEAAVILTNISSDTLVVSVDSLLSGDVSWEKWHSDSLFDVIDSDNYIQLLTDTGATNIVLLPYSINVATSTCFDDANGDGPCDLSCSADLNSDGIVSLQDLLYILSEFGCSSACETDINQDGIVGVDDLADIGLVDKAISEIRWITEGNPGEKIFKLEWWDCGYYEEIIALDSLGPSPSRYNAQIWLHEATGVIEYRFGVVDIHFELPLPAMPMGLAHSFDGNDAGEFYMLTGDESAPELVELTFNSVFSATLTGAPSLGRIYRFLPNPDQVVESPANQPLAIYPNPSRTMIQFNAGPGVKHWMLYDLVGREVDRGACQGQSTLDVKALSSGTYFLNVEGFKSARVMVR